ncbi:hypothetical protein AB0D34_08220 [Streptomyces sp. NPDC048420]|uniref:hypothetical protein n=1 Tax=Streptomyces sp. NPDC048420 TaxID=3155755 RepID=UPI003442E8C9
MATSRNAKARTVKLGERRTLLEEMPDGRPIINGSIYQMQHQVCVPGGWETVAVQQVIGAENQAGEYGPAGQMLEPGPVRQHAAALFDEASKALRKHPYGRLSELVSKVQLQEGTGEVGGWDDNGVVVEMAHLLRDLIV